ncbi:hypothetical protein J6590_064967 [Homalodisca vitripennis]|nr:hypothetical protein J6590_064967 [Homalodisca vitripennis]
MICRYTGFLMDEVPGLLILLSFLQITMALLIQQCEGQQALRMHVLHELLPQAPFMRGETRISRPMHNIAGYLVWMTLFTMYWSSENRASQAQ